MAKKKADNKKILFLVAVAFGILAILMFLLPMLSYHDKSMVGGNVVWENKIPYTGFDLLFGKSGMKITHYDLLLDKTTEIETEYGTFEAAVGPMIAAICTVVGIAVALVSRVINKKSQFIVKLISCVCFVAAAVLVVAIAKPTFVSANNFGDSFANLLELSIGAYLVCAFNAIAGVSILIS